MIKDIQTEAKYARTKLGYLPDILRPRTFNEFILHNKFFCRDPLLVRTTDKVAVCDYVREKGLENILIPNYFITDDPGKIPFNDLPAEYIVKPNQLSGSIIHFKNDINKEKIISTCREWLKVTHYGASRFIWCTSQIKPQIIIQKVIGVNPLDYKFHMIRGRLAFISVHQAASISSYNKTNISYNKNWNVLPFTYQQRIGRPVAKPSRLEEMIHIAEILSEPFNYVRVDLYNEDQIYFGELTHFPNSGAGRFTPEKYDYEFGKLFKA